MGKINPIPAGVTASQAAGHRWPTTSEAVMFLYAQGSKKKTLAPASGVDGRWCYAGRVIGGSLTCVATMYKACTYKAGRQFSTQQSRGRRHGLYMEAPLLIKTTCRSSSFTSLLILILYCLSILKFTSNTSNLTSYLCILRSKSDHHAGRIRRT